MHKMQLAVPSAIILSLGGIGLLWQSWWVEKTQRRQGQRFQQQNKYYQNNKGNDRGRVQLCLDIERERNRAMEIACVRPTVFNHCSIAASYIKLIQMQNKLRLVEETRPEQPLSVNPELQSTLSPILLPTPNKSTPPQPQTPENSQIRCLSISITSTELRRPFFSPNTSQEADFRGIRVSEANRRFFFAKLEQCSDYIMAQRALNFLCAQPEIVVPECERVEDYILEQMPFLSLQESQHYLSLLQKNPIITRLLQQTYDSAHLLLMNDLLLAAFIILKAEQADLNLPLSRQEVINRSLSTAFLRAFTDNRLQQLKINLLPTIFGHFVIASPPCLVQAGQLFTLMILQEIFKGRRQVNRRRRIRNNKLCKRIRRPCGRRVEKGLQKKPQS